MSRAIQITDAYDEERACRSSARSRPAISPRRSSRPIGSTSKIGSRSARISSPCEVKGDSMIEAQIADGDIVICRRARTAHKGDIVVAITDEGEATLKYWYPEANRIRLQPANSSMKPIYSRNAQVIGIVTGVVRRVV